VKKNAKRAIAAFKVIEVVTNRKSACDFLLIVTDVLSRAVSELSQLIVQTADTAFLSHPFGFLGTTYDVHILELIGKRLTDRRTS